MCNHFIEKTKWAMITILHSQDLSFRLNSIKQFQVEFQTDTKKHKLIS